MKKLMIAAVLFGAVTMPGTAVAHPNTPFSSRGACERALAETNKDDREAFGEFFPNRGGAQEFFRLNFECQLVGRDWFIIYIGG